jgi:hypothetical protein
VRVPSGPHYNANCHCITAPYIEQIQETSSSRPQQQDVHSHLGRWLGLLPPRNLEDALSVRFPPFIRMGKKPGGSFYAVDVCKCETNLGDPAW